MLILRESGLTIVVLMALSVQIALCRPRIKELGKRQYYDSDMLEDQVEQMEDQLENLQEQTEDCNEQLNELRTQNLVNDMFGGGFGGGFGGNGFGGGFGGGGFGGFGDMFGGWGGLFFDDRRRRSAVNKADKGAERTRRQWPMELLYERYLLSLYTQQQQQLLSNCVQQLAQFGVFPPTPPLNPVDTTPASVTPSDQASETTTQAAATTTVANETPSDQASETTTQAAETTTQAAETTQPPVADPTTQAAETTQPPVADPTTIEADTTTDDN